jgi:hypothetical protein
MQTGGLWECKWVVKSVQLRSYHHLEETTRLDIFVNRSDPLKKEIGYSSRAFQNRGWVSNDASQVTAPGRFLLVTKSRFCLS